MYYELLKPGEMVTSDRYRQQLIKLNEALKRKRPEWGYRTHKVILLHDNARSHVAKPVKTYLVFTRLSSFRLGEGTLPWAISFFLNEKNINIFRLMNIALLLERTY